MASGSHVWDAITISDNEDEVDEAHQGGQRQVPSIKSLPGFSPPSIQWRALSDEGRVSQRENLRALRFQRPSSKFPKFHHPELGDLTDGSNNLDHGPYGRQSSDVVLSHHSQDPCPYYYSTRFGLTMYCGPGFREFHPVLDSLDGHKEICDGWKERQRQRSTPALPLNSDIEEQRCLEQVLVVFPQVQHDFVRGLFREHRCDVPHMSLQPQDFSRCVSEQIIAQIAEMESVPSEKRLKRKRSPALQDGDDDKTITWNEVLRNNTYRREGLILLADEFPRIPTHFIQRTLDQKKTVYDAFEYLAESEVAYKNGPNRPYIRYKVGRKVLEKKYHRRATEQRDEHQYVSIVNEFQAARQRQSREETRGKKRRADEEAEAKNFVEHQAQGSLMECACCFNEVPINRVVNCENDEMHFFCNDCIKRRANEQIGVLRHEMTCMDTSACGAELSKAALERALPIKTSDKLADIQQLASIQAAGLEGLEQCPFCEFQAICPAIDIDTIFQCLNSCCEMVSCRKCKKESHLPSSCEENRRATTDLSARHIIEEARSEAMMRPCPKCKVKIIKSDGCNKMTCSKCWTVMCYVCKLDITSTKYQHFDGPNARCPLNDVAAEDRHRQEADEAEKAAIAVAKARDAEVNEANLRIEAHLNQVKTPSAVASCGRERI